MCCQFPVVLQRSSTPATLNSNSFSRLRSVVAGRFKQISNSQIRALHVVILTGWLHSYVQLRVHFRDTQLSTNLKVFVHKESVLSLLAPSLVPQGVSALSSLYCCGTLIHIVVILGGGYNPRFRSTNESVKVT